MSDLAVLFPVIVLLSLAGLIIFVIRLDRKLSRGAQSAGPRELVRPNQAGLQRTPWELRALDDQLRAATNQRARQDLVQTINRLSKAAGVTDEALQLPPNANDTMIAAVISHLEDRLELAPLPMPPVNG